MCQPPKGKVPPCQEHGFSPGCSQPPHLVECWFFKLFSKSLGLVRSPDQGIYRPGCPCHAGRSVWLALRPAFWRMRYPQLLWGGCGSIKTQQKLSLIIKTSTNPRGLLEWDGNCVFWRLFTCFDVHIWAVLSALTHLCPGIEKHMQRGCNSQSINLFLQVH